MFDQLLIDDHEEILRLFEEVDTIHRKAVPQVFRKPNESSRTRKYFSDLIQDKNGALFVAEIQKHTFILARVL